MAEYKTAKEIGSDKLYYIDGLATVKQAVEMMKKNDVEALIIEKRNERDANGIIVLSDIIRGVVIPDKKLDEVSVYELMKKPVISIPASMNERYVPRFLANINLNYAPVEENGQYVGMVSLKRYLFDRI
jgi:signal-transduction protein with cAMP-binding, CBS, and nucleotidyltransferase domain